MNRIIVALDVPTVEQAGELARPLLDTVGGFKVGMELLMGAGPRAVETIADLGKPVFVDAKLHDIPNTVQRAAARVRDAGARWVTVHASGGVEMVAAAVSGMGGGSGVLAVTMLTSLTADDLVTIGIPGTPADYVAIMARLAAKSGAEGAVCAPAEAGVVKSAEPGLVVFTPGIRPSTSVAHDQKRVATPQEARAAGADYLVVGRPITGAADPVAVAREIGRSIATFG